MAGPWVRTSVSNHPPSPLSSAWASISLSASRASFVICRFRVASMQVRFWIASRSSGPANTVNSSG